MAEPNTILRAVRISLRLSQDELAQAIREDGKAHGEPNDCAKRNVQRWESGKVGMPRKVYTRSLERVTGLPIEALGFAVPVPNTRATDAAPTNGHGPAHGEAVKMGATTAPGGAVPMTKHSDHGTLSGIWLSRYEYHSSGRESDFTGEHFVVIIQHGNKLTARSLPEGSSNPDSPLTMDLTVDGNVVTGTWREETAQDGYYAGAVYHGALQLLVEPTGRKMVGKWVGFGKDFDVNTGPWELTFKDPSTSKATMAEYNRRP
ncbi:helix-turn-helix domain-containing protein [Streptomyces sp. ET3-23]|uniref:helix-turn-helix domain-containing protein n=1 Tax=Streptomyces sp. ET3-23 TaxID=2885643 RepID=UPI001D10070F|nr:helix-turn-helix transcriptional regulator [Streptomyces sp. ET3-23]MCC2278499.1 helix-turn-helix domain-containing protein [Streptomyces sp. ET3-23]